MAIALIMFFLQKLFKQLCCCCCLYSLTLIYIWIRFTCQQEGLYYNSLWVHILSGGQPCIKCGESLYNIMCVEMYTVSIVTSTPCTCIVICLLLCEVFSNWRIKRHGVPVIIFVTRSREMSHVLNWKCSILRFLHYFLATQKCYILMHTPLESDIQLQSYEQFINSFFANISETISATSDSLPHLLIVSTSFWCLWWCQD